jgi:hypothetical protein
MMQPEAVFVLLQCELPFGEVVRNLPEPKVCDIFFSKHRGHP